MVLVLTIGRSGVRKLGEFSILSSINQIKGIPNFADNFALMAESET